MTHPECIVIGGGVIGLSLAWELAQAGVATTLLDAAPEHGPCTSWAGVGILPPANWQTAIDPLERLRALSHQLHPQWSQRLREQTGLDNGFRACGGIYLATSRGEQATLAGLAGYWQQFDIDAQALTPSQLVQREPALSEIADSGRLLSAWSLPGECSLRSPDHLQALRMACQQAGVAMHADCRVDAINVLGDRIADIDTSDGVRKADLYCLAGGAWTRRLLDSMSIPTGMLPVRGQVLLFKRDRPLTGAVINEGNRYLVSRDDGHLLVGSNEEEVGFEFGTSREVIESLTNWAVGIVPELGNVALKRSWSGLRPGSFDTFPYIGRLPNLSNGYVAAGHFRSGLHLSCATATELTRLILGQPTLTDLAPFSPQRG